MSPRPKAKGKTKSGKQRWQTTPIFLEDYEDYIHKSALTRIAINQDNPEKYYHELLKHAYAEQWRRLNMLFDHYNIPETSPIKWEMLASYLAEENFKGLRIERNKSKVGKKIFWTGAKYKLLYEQYREHQKAYPTKSDEMICAYLSNQKPWLENNFNTKAMQNELSKAKAMTGGALPFKGASLIP